MLNYQRVCQRVDSNSCCLFMSNLNCTPAEWLKQSKPWTWSKSTVLFFGDNRKSKKIQKAEMGCCHEKGDAAHHHHEKLRLSPFHFHFYLQNFGIPPTNIWENDAATSLSLTGNYGFDMGNHPPISFIQVSEFL